MIGPRFNKYDYGWIFNLKHYGQLIPPAYDLSKVTVPVHIFHGQNDYVASPKVMYKYIYKYCHFKMNSILLGRKMDCISTSQREANYS